MGIGMVESVRGDGRGRVEEQKERVGTKEVGGGRKLIKKCDTNRMGRARTHAGRGALQ
jgi:hypothetical protein